MKESRSEFVANDYLANTKVQTSQVKGDWTQPSPNRFRSAGASQQSLFDRVLKVLLPIRGV